MKRNLFLTLAIFSAFIFQAQAQTLEWKIVTETSASMHKFLTRFEKSILKHDHNKLMKFMHKNYVQEQHDKFLEGRTEQFINELFCGDNLKHNQFECIKLSQIQKITRLRIEKNGHFQRIVYRIETQNTQVEIVLGIQKQADNKKYGLNGAVG